MSYPQSGGYGYGQNPPGAQQYGQPADYGQYGGQQYGDQQYGGQQYGDQQYAGQQYGGQYGQQQGYDAQAQAQYGQQYQQQAQYGYGVPQQPSNPGLPANTPTIIAAVIGALGIITLFCGFLDAVGVPDGYSGSAPRLYESFYVGPYILIAAAGVVALTTFILGVEKWVVGSVFALTVVSALVTIFQFSTAEGDKGVGGIILLITSILSAIAAVVWLLVEGGQVKLASAEATQSVPVDASQYAAQQQAAAAPAVDYGYGQQYQQQAQAQQAQAGQAQAGQAQPGQYNPTQFGQSTHAQQPGDSSATTAFVKPPTDPGANPQSEQH
ncbi:DUF5336 domain-containing protein [Gordonia sp. (in: high G+C Gram-positive bacteria)]|uniref:DUF5336 domain-containing protein n=1 Tax=Gordonia sp. (in: high G+C Gram-positive bacteria) TaxID=84139 RepID=UPI003F94C253